jgi:ABC-type transporter Mla subunit MlaD
MKMKIVHDCTGQARIRRLLETIEKRTRTMATQDDIDQLTTRMDQRDAQLQSALDGIRQDVADLKAEHPEVDLSRLDAAIGQFEQLTDTATELDGENPAPPAV